MPVVSFNGPTVRLNHFSQLNVGSLALGGGNFEFRATGAPSANVRSPANVRLLDSSQFSQWTTGTSSIGGGSYSFRINDGMRHDEILQALKVMAQYVRVMNVRTTQCDTVDCLDFLNSVEQFVRINRIEAV